MSLIYVNPYAFSGIVTDGLVLHLDAGNSTSYPGSGTAWTDLSGKGNNATLTNGPTYSSADGGSIDFDGTNDYALGSTSSDFLFGTGDYTMSYWFRADTFSGGPTIVDLRNGSGIAQAYSDFIGSNKFKLWMHPTVIYDGGITTLSTATWYNACVTRSGSAGSVYINATLDGTFTNSTNMVQGQFKIAGNVSVYFNGRVSNALVYKGKALTATEVTQNFNALRGRYGL
jgi:hypothetical protein